MLLSEGTFIISDTHFGDYDSIANGFDKYLVDAWNKTVSENDTVLHMETLPPTVRTWSSRRKSKNTVNF